MRGYSRWHGRCCYRPEGIAFVPVATVQAVHQGFAPNHAVFAAIEEHPSRLPSGPPRLPPRLFALFAWTTWCDHRLVPLSGHLVPSQYDIHPESIPWQHSL